MPCFHFQTFDPQFGLDEEVCELADIASARRASVRFASDVLREVGTRVYEDKVRIIVTDDAGRLCWDLQVSAVEGPGATSS